MGFPDPNNVTRMCPCCEADGVTFTDNGTSLAMPVWYATQWALRSLEAWRAAHPDCHVLFRNLPGTTINNHIPDWMHVKNLGSDAEFFGSLLVFMCFFMGLGPDPDAVLVMIWRRLLFFVCVFVFCFMVFFLLSICCALGRDGAVKGLLHKKTNASRS